MLTDPSFIRRLDSLYLLARKVLGGTLQADRKSTKKGTGITFADYAEYYYGADYRAIDWRVFAKFESLVVKLFELEEDATIYLLLDGSHSMRSKFEYAKQLAAALGYIGLNCLDRVCVYALADTLSPLMEPRRGRGNAMRFLQALEEAQTFGGDTTFTNCCKIFHSRHRRKGLVLVISDFLFPAGFQEGLKFLQYYKHDVYCLQVMDETDTRCDWKGDVEIECVETGQHQRITVSPREAKLYEDAVAKWNADLKQCCAQRGIGLASTTPNVAFDTVIQDILRRGGLIA